MSNTLFHPKSRCNSSVTFVCRPWRWYCRQSCVLRSSPCAGLSCGLHFKKLTDSSLKFFQKSLKHAGSWQGLKCYCIAGQGPAQGSSETRAHTLLSKAHPVQGELPEPASKMVYNWAMLEIRAHDKRTATGALSMVHSESLFSSLGVHGSQVKRREFTCFS